MQNFFAVKPGDLRNPFFSHGIRWGTGRKNLTFLSDDCIAALSNYDPLAELAARLPQSFPARDPVSKAQVLEMEIFLTNYLLSSQGDRVAMAHSVELRHPFLDFRVIDYAFKLPAKWKIRGLDEKYILKQAFKGLVPERITKRDKQPYRAPIREMFSPDAPHDYVDDLLSEGNLKKSGYFNAMKVNRLLAKYRKPDDGFSTEFQNMALTGILSTQLLHHQFVENQYVRTVGQIRPDKVITTARVRR